MEESARQLVGIDIGTENVRVVMATVGRDNVPTVVGYAEKLNSGMRKGEIVNLNGPAAAIDKALAEAETMSGIEAKQAVVSVNGAKIMSQQISGMIAAGNIDHEIDESDLDRIEQAALTGRMPQNREILEIIPSEYVIDGQGGIKNPLGMRGARIEMQASVVSAMTPNCDNIRKMMAEMVELPAVKLVPEAVAAGRAVLTERQIENGVAVMNFGAATTSVAVFDEGDLKTVFVLPLGADMITKDLANVLEIDMETAEELKRRFVTGVFDGESESVTLKKQGKELIFARESIDNTARARMEDIFTRVAEELKQAGHSYKLPEGMIMVGGGAKMRGIEVMAKEVLRMATKIGTPKDLAGVAEAVMKPEYATAVGLMLQGMAVAEVHAPTKKTSGDGGFLKKLFSKF